MRFRTKALLFFVALAVLFTLGLLSGVQVAHASESGGSGKTTTSTSKSTKKAAKPKAPPKPDLGPHAIPNPPAWVPPVGYVDPSYSSAAREAVAQYPTLDMGYNPEALGDLMPSTVITYTPPVTTEQCAAVGGRPTATDYGMICGVW